MTTTSDGPARPRRPPGPKPRGRTVVALAITLTHAQRAALGARVDAGAVSISTIVRRFVAARQAADEPPIIPIPHDDRTDRGDVRTVGGHARVSLGMAAGRAVYRCIPWMRSPQNRTLTASPAPR